MCVCVARVRGGRGGRPARRRAAGEQGKSVASGRAPRDEQFRALEPAHRFTLPRRRRKPSERARPRADGGGQRARQACGASAEAEWFRASASFQHTHFSLLRRAASRQHVRGPGGGGLALRRRPRPSRGADLALGYRFRPPLFARARLPARASHRRWSPVSIRRGSSTPHPDSNRGLSSQMPSCSLGSDPPTRQRGEELGPKRALPVLGDVIMRRAKQLA